MLKQDCIERFWTCQDMSGRVAKSSDMLKQMELCRDKFKHVKTIPNVSGQDIV